MNPLGTIVAIFNTSIPTEPSGEEWMFCDGSAINRGDYKGLYALIGDMFGAGDDVSKFNLPKLQNQFIRGLDMSLNGTSGRDVDSAARTPMATNTMGGNHVGSLQSCELKAHSHPISGKRYVNWRGYESSVFSPDVGGAQWGTTELEGDDETRPKNVAVNFIIRVL